MTLWQDGVIAVLAAIGLTTILWGLAEMIFRKRDTDPGAVVVLPLWENAPQVEHHVQTLMSRRRRLGSQAAILLLDCGLTAEGVQRATLLTRRYEGVALIKSGDLTMYWTQI